MPEIRSKTRPRLVEVSVGDEEPIAISFDANRITPGWVREAQKRDEVNDPESLPKALSEVIVSWDVTEDGQPLAPSDGLARLSYSALSELLVEMLKAAAPASEEGNASGNTSSTPSIASSSMPESPQNGLTPSPSPTPSASPSPT